jgi:hypothetical protein
MKVNVKLRSAAASKSLGPTDGITNSLKDYAKFTLCILPMLAVIAFGIYCLFIDV